MNLPEIKNFFSICRSYTFHYLNQGPDLEIKIASQKNPSIVRKIARHSLKHFWVLWNVLVNLQKEFIKHAIVISLILHLLLFFQ